MWAVPVMKHHFCNRVQAPVNQGFCSNSNTQITDFYSGQHTTWVGGNKLQIESQGMAANEQQLTARLGLLTADLRGTPAVLVLALLTAPSALSCLGALGLSVKWQKGSSGMGETPGTDGLQSQYSC